MTLQQEFALSHPCLEPEDCADPSYGWRVDVRDGYVRFFLTVCVLDDGSGCWMATGSLHRCETEGTAPPLPFEKWTVNQREMVRVAICEATRGVGEFSGQCWDSKKTVMVLDRNLTSEEKGQLDQSLSTKKLKD
jgi:hypothetical protein